MLIHELQSYDDTASLMAGLDEVVTVDTSVLHLAGSVGTPTGLVLTRAHQDWRWGIADTTPWYANVKIHRSGLEQVARSLDSSLRARPVGLRRLAERATS